MKTDPTVDGLGELPEPFPDAPAALGEVLHGRWTVSEIHRGGQAWVLVVDDIGQADRRAIKVPLSGSLTGDAELAALLSLERHPHIVTALDTASVDGRHGLMLEYVPTTLAELLRQGHPAPASGWPQLIPRLEVLQEICAGMDHLSAGAAFAHLDLKPSNVLIDGAGTAKVADFGLAQQVLIRDDGHFSPAKGGTWAYAAPEVIRREPYDSRADIFSFGVLLYEAYTGRLPYPFALAPTPARQRAQPLDYYRSTSPERRTEELYYWEQTRSKMTQVPVVPPGEEISVIISSCLQVEMKKRPPHFENIAMMLAEGLRIPRPRTETEPLPEIDRQRRELTLGQTLIRLGRFDEAVRRLNRLLVSSPPPPLSPVAWNALREALVGAGRGVEAAALEGRW
ncbi:MAG: serine/threonine-protein kinase [Actinoallomurus sp.]